MMKDTQIKALKPKEKSYAKSVGDGLSIVVNPNGSKKWRLRYYFKKKPKNLSLGSYPALSLADARMKVHDFKKALEDGTDPAAKKKEDSQAAIKSISFADVGDAYLVSRGDNVSSHHLERSESLLRLYAKPVLGDEPIEDITHKDIKNVIINLSNMGKKASAKKLFGVLKQVFDYAELHDYVEVNICNLLNPSTLITDYIPKKHSTLLKPKEIKQLMKSIENYEGHYSTKRALQFMALTALRSFNVRSAKWEYISFDDALMTIPKEDMKIEKKKLEDSHDFKLPLSKQAMKILDEMKPLSGNGTYIFPSIRGDRPMSENALLVMVRNMGYTKDQFTPHGFRAMFSTISNQEGDFNIELIDAQLAHKVGNTVSQRYNRSDYLKKRYTLAQWWANWLMP